MKMKYQKYNQEAMERAVQLVKAKQMSQLAASRAFGVPQSTLNNKVLGTTPMKRSPKTVLSAEEEQKLASWLVQMSMRGFGRTKEDLKDTVKAFLDKKGKATIFKNNRPGKDWVAAFLSRHKEISERMPQALGRERAMVDKASLIQWFRELKEYVDSVDPNLLKQPHRLYNADESGFSICPKTKKVLAPVGAKHVYNLTSSSRTQITALACSSAAGEYLPPLLIFPYQRHPRFNPLEGFEEAFFQRTKNGWVSAEVFQTWIRDVFVPAVEDKPKPVILYVDGHTSHVTSIETCQLCQEKGILLYCLRPHSSHITQPLDQAFFGVLKRAWSEAVRKYMFQTGEVVTMPTFSRVLSGAWKTATRPEIAFSGFARAGLFPFDPSVAINSEKMKAADNFVRPSPHPQKTPESAPQVRPPPTPESESAPKVRFPPTPESEALSKGLEVFEELIRMGSETNLRNIERMREGYSVADPDFFKWRDMVLGMLGAPTSSVSDPVETLTSFAIQPHDPELEPSNSRIEPTASSSASFEPNSQIDPTPSTSQIDPTPPEARLTSSASVVEPTADNRGQSLIDEVLVLPTIKSRSANKKEGCHTMALSSQAYVDILKEKEDKKKELEEAKKKRKTEREDKKKKREEKKEEKKRQREIEKERKRKEREEKKSNKGKGPSRKRLRREESEDDGADCDIMEIERNDDVCMVVDDMR